MNTGRISQNFGKGARNFVSGLGRNDALLPIVLLEAAVIGGRTYNAYDRGGFIEARERGTEEVVSSVFWLFGVQAFNMLGDKVGKKVLGLKDIDFEVGKDAVRNPVKNYMQKIPKYDEKVLGAFKLTKIISSILLTNAIIGFVVPKINQAITRKYQKSLEEIENKKNELPQQENIQQFADKAPQKSNKDTAFKGMGVSNLLMLANSFENDARYKLLSTDVGIAGGRAVNARNKHERREILFRDLSSLYFYMFCRMNLNSFLNQVESGRSQRLDPTSTNILDAHLQENLKSKPSYSAEEFERLVLGEKVEIPKKVQNKITNGIIRLEEFEKIVGKNSALAKRAQEMSKLQPKLEGVSILSSEQLKDVYSGGLINNPKMLGEIFEKFSNKKSTNPMSFFPEKDLGSVKQQMVDYVEDIVKKAKASGDSITIKTLRSAERGNFWKNAFNLGAGFAVSAYFLSTAIPKIQYWMTRKRTGKDKFPGVEKYDK